MDKKQEVVNVISTLGQASNVARDQGLYQLSGVLLMAAQTITGLANELYPPEAEKKQEEPQEG
jgi:hypothetical protein